MEFNWRSCILGQIANMMIFGFSAKASIAIDAATPNLYYTCTYSLYNLFWHFII